MAIKTFTLNTLKSLIRIMESRYTKIGDIANYTVTKQASAENGYAASYNLMKDGEIVGSTINIPKDYLVKSASVKEVTTADTPVQGYVIGDKYIDFVVNSIDNDGAESHIYIALSDLTTVYTPGNGINIDSTNAVSVKVNTSNGLTVDSNGININLATASSAGAMSAADKNKLSKCTTSDDFEEITAAEIGALFE